MTILEFWIMWFSMGALAIIFPRIVSRQPRPLWAYLVSILLGGVSVLFCVGRGFFDYILPWLKNCLDNEF